MFGYIRTKAKFFINKVDSRRVALAGAMVTAAVSAHADLPAAVATTVTSIQGNGQAIFDLVFPVVGVFLGLDIVIKLFKRFSNKV